MLDEDGTAVETEAFFRTLEEGTVLMALSKGQTWAPSKVSASLGGGAGPWFVPSASHGGNRWGDDVMLAGRYLGCWVRWDWEGGGVLLGNPGPPLP